MEPSESQPIRSTRNNLDFQLNSEMERGFPGGSVGKESACNAENPGSVPGLGRSPREVNGYALQYSCTQVFLPGESNGQRSPVGYSTWGHSVGHN